MKKELLDAISEEKFINKLIESSVKEDYFITTCSPIFTLKEALEALDEHILDFIYEAHKMLISPSIMDATTKNEKIKNLEECILTSFTEFLEHLTKDDKLIIEDVIKNTYTKKMDVNLLSAGFLYGYKQNGEKAFVVPNELLDIYKTYQNSPEKVKNDYKKANEYIATYMLMNGILEKKFIENVLIKEYELNITKEQIKDILNEQFINYRDDYYAPMANNESNAGLEALITIKKQFENKILNEEDLMLYNEMIKDLTFELRDVLNKNTLEQVFYKPFISDLPLDELINELEIPKKQHKKVKEILEKYDGLFRYWEYSGRTSNEANLYYHMINPAFEKKPDFSDLSTCLSKLSSEMYESITSYYDKTENLKEEILNNLKDEVEFYDSYVLDEIIKMNHKEVCECLDASLLDKGYIYLYKDKKKVKSFIPKEILNILEESANKPEEEMLDLDFIDAYVNMNGVIEKETLRKLLKDNHDIDLSIKELDDAIEFIDAYIVDNKYYTFIENIDLKETINIMNMKKNFAKYNVANLENESKETEFKDNLIDLLATEYGDNEKCEVAYEKIVFGIKTGVGTVDFFEAMLKDEKLLAPKKISKQILELYNQYKNYISVWIYNGYPLPEALEMKTVKSTKVGRNELCPCGSGKKYKKCCGK